MSVMHAAPTLDHDPSKRYSTAWEKRRVRYGSTGLGAPDLAEYRAHVRACSAPHNSTVPVVAQCPVYVDRHRAQKRASMQALGFRMDVVIHKQLQALDRDLARGGYEPTHIDMAARAVAEGGPSATAV